MGMLVHDAEDAVQEAFVRARDRIERGDVENPKAYLFTIVRNYVFERRRLRTRFLPVEMPDDLPAQPPEDNLFRNADLLAAFQEAMSQLPDPSRKLIDAYYVKGCTLQQIGDQLRCSPQNVFQRLHRIKQSVLAGKLKTALEKTDPDLARELFKSSTSTPS